MRMPELLVYGRMVISGFLLAEGFRLAFLASSAFGYWISDALPLPIVCAALLFCFAIPVVYGWKRQAIAQLRRMIASWRIDLLASVALGIWADFLVAPKLAKVHAAISRQDMGWAPLVLGMLIVVLLASVTRDFIARRSKPLGQVHFLPDDEIGDEREDALGIAEQAKGFAQTVLAAGAQTGLVFGIDAPWGTGKTSFLNIAVREWAKSEFTVVVNFQTLRYASEPDLSDRFIREMCTAIQKQAFAPEFAPAADRYSRILKGKTDVSFLGFRLSLEPSAETIDELLEDVDAVLKQSRRRLIVIIEDLDRLEPRLVNNVLFTVRRTFRLSQAAYILCYDTEMLVAGREEGWRARDFLEKFIAVKQSLFVDGEVLRKFLLTDWKKDASRFPLIPADTMFKLSGVMNVVANMVAGKESHHYAPLVGDLRKLKRLVNAMLLMQLDKFDLGRSDFDPQDLVHLVLLHLRYPGIFRKIYLEETEGRSGMFSLKRGDARESANLRNADGFDEFTKQLDETGKFLVKKLFDIRVLKFGNLQQPSEDMRRSRACFNSESRNLENYLKLIVRFTAPTDVETFRLYREAVDAVIAGTRTIKEVLSSDQFSLRHGEHVQDKLWRVLVNSAHELQPLQANEVIDQMINVLPTYPSTEGRGRGLRQRSIFALATLLDRVGYGAPRNGRIRDNTNVREIAARILGESSNHSPALIERIAAPERGPLGWNDLMVFRLVCSIDREGSLSNVYRGLLQFEDPEATGGGEVSFLAVNSLRRMSQRIFKLFKTRYIEVNVNFYLAVDEVSDSEIFGHVSPPQGDGDKSETPDAVRSTIKTFVIYQLVNDQRGTGAGVGCGFYDEDGADDQCGIRTAMTHYLLDFCFDPSVRPEHAFVFGDFCVRSMREASYLVLGEVTSSSIESALTKVLPRKDLVLFWQRHREFFQRELLNLERGIITNGLVTTYKEALPSVFSTLDFMAGVAADTPMPTSEAAS
ncbi:P-loop NTPase fold protein [Hydrogenophaga sp.]|uniref:P-loop NTPase fold protein n=1 Tax=Hydrogenophaga sp. TaxID=1904254 RepID=UPI003D0D9670